ncbi:MAG: hypothetical protein AB7I13_00140 [Vicinamibacterales bacterium]
MTATERAERAIAALKRIQHLSSERGVAEVHQNRPTIMFADSFQLGRVNSLAAMTLDLLGETDRG